MAPALRILLATPGLLAAEPTRVLFVGNSFTFVHDLPQQFQNVAKSLGSDVETGASTIGGCTLYAQEASRDDTTAKLLQQDWDYLVLQDYSMLPTVKKAREQYLKAAVKDFISQKKQAKVVLYLTWGYESGSADRCPSSDNADCFPLGTLADMTDCSSSEDYHNTVQDFPCMGYSLARGYFDAKTAGADMVAPCGLAWQVVRGVESIPSTCKAAIDAEYSSPAPLALPLRVADGSDPNLLLYIKDSETEFDKHPSRAGCYLNALTFYATIFGKSPVGAAAPLPTTAWGLPDVELTSSQLETLQRAAAGVVQQCGHACGLATLMV